MKKSVIQIEGDSPVHSTRHNLSLPVPSKAPQTDGYRRSAFTLVEILVVVVILGTLAAIVVPQFTSASEASRENSLKMNLFHTRQQIEIYRHHHNSTWPEVDQFEQQMTRASNVDGQTADPGTAGYPFGPYLREIPPNPFTSGNSVGDGDIGTSDWYYNQDTGEFRANHSQEHRDL